MSQNLQREVPPWEARVEGKPAGPSVASMNIPSAPRATYHKVVPISNIFRGFRFFVETVRDEDKRFRKDPQLIEAIKGGGLCRGSRILQLTVGERRQTMSSPYRGHYHPYPHCQWRSGHAHLPHTTQEAR